MYLERGRRGTVAVIFITLWYKKSDVTLMPCAPQIVGLGRRQEGEEESEGREGAAREAAGKPAPGSQVKEAFLRGSRNWLCQMLLSVVS